MTHLLRILKRALPPAALLLGLLAAPAAQAQVDNYTFAASSGTFVPNGAAATAVTGILADDAVSGPLPIFPFTFDGTVYTSVQASSNGFLSFAPAPVGGGLTGYNNDLSGLLQLSSTPSSTVNRPLIAPCWDDLDGRTSGAAASFQTTGTAPNRVFTFEWLNWNRFSNAAGPAAFSFQVKLFETTNVVQTVYRNESGAIVTGTPITFSIGLAGTSTGTGEYLSLNNASAAPTASSTTATNTIGTFPATGQVYTFTPAPPAACPAARGVSITNITGTGATLNFRPSPTATSYTVVLTPLGGPAGAPRTVTTSPVQFTGLTVNTSYTVSITPTCAVGTAPAVTATFATSNGYCVTGSGTTVLGGTCGGNDVTDVTLIGTTLSATGLTCNSPVAGTAYTQYPATGAFTGILQQGSIYTLNVTTSGNSIVSVWIDYNRDLVFDASEFTQVALTTTAGTASGISFTVPTGGTVQTGRTAMRIRTRASGNANGATDACSNFFSGETKDFAITIAPPPACPAAVSGSLNATAVGTTTATLNYTPATTGTGTYAIIYGPQGFNPATGGTTVPNAAASSPVTGLQPGTVYQFYVLRDCGAVGTSVLVGPAFFTTTIVNNDPCGATPLPLGLGGCVPFATTLVGATATLGIPAPQGCVFGSNPRDVWFTFTTSASGFGSTDIRVSVSGQAAGGMQVLTAATCAGPFTAVRCIGGSSTVAAPALDLTGLTPNTTYYLRVYAYSPAVQLGGFTVCVTPLPSCPTPTGVAATNVTKNGATLAWGTGTAPANSTYTITYGPPGFNPDQTGTNVTGVMGTSFALTGLIPQTNYCFYIRLNCGGLNGNSNRVGPVCFQTLQEAPANDEPCTAQSLTAGAANVTGDLVGATTTRLPGIVLPGCAPTPNPRDVWFTVATPPATVGTDSLVLFVNNAAAGMVRIFTAPSCSAGPFVLVRCFAATAGNTGFGGNPLSVGQLAPGTTYYVAVSNYNTSDTPGTFSIRANVLYVGPPCNPVTGLAATAITQNSASIAFTPGAFNSTYTITYGITGSGSTTLPTTTPAATALTGLVPLTQYTVTVNPACANGGSAPGRTITFTTTAPVCNAVTNLVVGNPGTDSLRVSYTPGAGNTSYLITYTAVGSTRTDTVRTTNVRALLTSLAPGTLYSVTVTPICSGGGAAGGVSGTATTLQPPCNPVTNVTTNNVGATSLGVAFTPGLNNTSYVVTFGVTGSATTTTVTVQAPATTAALTGLTPRTSYTIVVTGICANTLSPGTASAPVVVVTGAAPCLPVTNVVASNLTATTATVSFATLPSNTGYVVTYQAAGGPVVTVPGPITTSPVLLTGLVARTAYAITVTPQCGGGMAPTTTASFTTPLSARTALGRGFVTVFPNPASRSATLSVPALDGAARSATLTITNALGQVVLRQALALAATGTEAPLNLADLASGVYQVQLRTEGQTAVLRLVVE